MKADSERIFKQAIEQVQPGYFEWTADQKETYGWKISNEDYFQIKQYLLECLFGIVVKNNEGLDDATRELSPDEWRQLNEIMLPLVGIGDDCLFLNELLRKPLQSYPTLHDYAYENHQFQEKANRSDDPEYSPQPYLGMLWHAWARLKVNKEFSYATLCTSAEYITEALQESCQKQLSSMIPSSYVEGPRHMQKTDDGHFVWDMVLEADGREGQLDWLRTEVFFHLRDLQITLGEEFNRQASCETYILDATSFDGETRKEFVFSDIEALKVVSFSHFVDSCTAIKANAQRLLSRLEAEKQAMDVFLQDKYDYIMENYDPSMNN